MESIEYRGIAVQFPKSIHGIALELALELNRIKKDNPQYVVAVGSGVYAVRVGDGAVVSYDLDDVVP